MDLGERIAVVRGFSGLSQRDMSEFAGLTESHVRLLEIGARKEPSVETIRRIAEAFDVSLDWLVSGIGDPPNESAVRIIAERLIAAREAKRTGSDG